MSLKLKKLVTNSLMCFILISAKDGLASDNYNVDVVFPDVSSSFYSEVKFAGTLIGGRFGPAYQPEDLQFGLFGGQVARLTVLIPPGTEHATFSIDTGIADGVAWLATAKTLPYCGSGASSNQQSTCIADADMYSLSNISTDLYPLRDMNTFTPIEASGIFSQACFRDFILKAGPGGFSFMSVNAAMSIKDPTKYMTWRNSRPWGGGAVTNDVYGLGASCGGTPSDTIPPIFSSATVNGSTLVLNYTEATALDADHLPPVSAFTVKVGNVVQLTPLAVAINAANKTVTLTLSAAVANGAEVTVSYTDPTVSNDANAIQDAAGNDAETIKDKVVTVVNPPAGQFTISAPTTQIMVGGTITLTASGGTFDSCSTTNQNVISVQNGASATVLKAVGAGSADVACTNMTGMKSNTLTFTVTQPVTSAFSLTSSSLTVKPNGSFTLSAMNGSIERCFSDNISAILDPEVSSDGTTALGVATGAALPDNPVKITCLSTKTPSDVATVFVTIIPVSTSFSLTPITIKAVTSTSVTVTTTASVAVTGYWVALPLGAVEPTAPTVTEIKSGTFGAANGGKDGNASLALNAATDFALNGLSTDKNYRVYFYAEPNGATTGIYQIFNIATITPAAAVITPESITGDTSGSKQAAQKLNIIIKPASNHTGLGKYYVAAYVPDVGLFFYAQGGMDANGHSTTAGWLNQWKGVNPLDSSSFISYSQSSEDLQTGKTISVLDGMDVTPLKGTTIYGAYENSAGDLVVNAVYKIQ